MVGIQTAFIRGVRHFDASKREGEKAEEEEERTPTPMYICNGHVRNLFILLFCNCFAVTSPNKFLPRLSAASSVDAEREASPRQRERVRCLGPVE